MAKVLIAMTDSFEEIEALTIIDALRRAKFDTITSGLGKKKALDFYILLL